MSTVLPLPDMTMASEAPAATRPRPTSARVSCAWRARDEAGVALALRLANPWAANASGQVVRLRTRVSRAFLSEQPPVESDFVRIHQDDHPWARARIREAYQRQLPIRIEARWLCPAGGYRWKLMVGGPVFGPDGSFAGVSGTALDITEQKEIGSAQQPSAAHDPLTRMLDRHAFLEAVQATGAGPGLPQPPVGILVMALGNVAEVNDLLGPRASDGMITEVAERLRRLVSKDEGVAGRIGTYEFALGVSAVTDAGLEHVARPVSRL